MNTRGLSLFAAALVMMSVAVCHRHSKPAEGPVQRAGKHIDNAAEKTKNAAKDVKNDVKRDLK